MLAIIFVSYLAGGYVAGRMARFNGLKQGLGVWLWAVIMAILLGVAGWLAGARFDVLARVNSFPRLPLSEGTLTTGGIIVAIGVVAASLVGALLGGLAGMRYHRRVDRAGLGPVQPGLAPNTKWSRTTRFCRSDVVRDHFPFEGEPGWLPPALRRSQYLKGPDRPSGHAGLR